MTELSSAGDLIARLNIAKLPSILWFGLCAASSPIAAHSFSRRREMDWNVIEGNWKQAQGKIKQKWGKLTEDDLTKINGQREQLEGILQQRYGLAKDMVRKDIDAWLKSQP